MIGSALYILMVPGEFGKSILPDRYERVTSGMGSTVRGQIVLGGLASCESLTLLPHDTRADLQV